MWETTRQQPASPFQVRSHSLRHHRSQPLLQHCMGHIVHPLHTHTHTLPWGMETCVKGLLWRKCRVSRWCHIHTLSGQRLEELLDSVTAQVLKVWNKPAVFAILCLSDTVWACVYVENACMCVCVHKWMSVTEGYLKTVPGRYLVKDLESDLILSSRHDKAEYLWF